MSRVGALSIVALLSLGCAGGAESTAVPSLPWELTPFPTVTSELPAARVQLGSFLFYDPILSIDGETACATCHSEHWGMSDALQRSVGQGAGIIAGPLREGPNVLRRNAQALWNLAFRSDLFWDGRTSSLEEQALSPLLEEAELNRPPEEVVNDLATIPEYASLFEESFPEDPRVTVDNMAQALADFQRTLVSNRSLYDGYARGDVAAMSDDMIEGMFRFAEMGCVDCHTPPLFESSVYANRRVPPLDGVADQGRYEVTGLDADRGKFRVPTLRNVTFTHPYFHNGSVQKLSDAVRHELEEGEQPFTDEDVRLITTFVDQALRDQSREPDRPEVVPSGLQVPLDGTAILR